MPRIRARVAALILCLLGAAHAAPGRAADHAPEYVSPADGARYVNPGTNVIIRPGGPLDPQCRVDASLFTVIGSLSGSHGGRVARSDLGDAVVFVPDRPFEPGETVTVALRAGLRTVDGTGVAPVASTFEVSAPAPLPTPYQLEELGQSDSESDVAPAGPPTLVVTTAGATAPGRIFLCDLNFFDPNYGSHLLIFENDGTPVFQRMLRGWALGLNVQPNGMLTYFDRAAGAFFALDTMYAVVDSFRMGNGYATDVHELRVLPNGHALLMAYDPQIVDVSQIIPGGSTTATVLGLIIQELDAQKNVVFQWRSWDHFEITDAVDFGPPPVINYVHGNAIELDTDGNLLISCRHMDEITKIDRRTGKIMWRLGGKNNQFEFINDPIRFSHQHDIRRLPNGHVTLYDNGNFHTPRFSRAVEYRLDERRKTATLVWEYRKSPNVYAGAMGNVQRLPNGNTLIGWGWAIPTVTEVTPAGDVVFEGTLYTGTRRVSRSYRAYRHVWPPRAREAPDHEVEVRFEPAILNVQGPGNWLSAEIRPAGFGASDVDLPSIRLQGIITIDPKFAEVGDRNLDGRPELRVRVSRGQLGRVLAPGLNTVEVSGLLTTGETFAGADDIRLIGPPRGPAAVSVAPNPLNPIGVLRFTTMRPGRVSVRLYDLQGRLVQTVLEAPNMAAGAHAVRVPARGSPGRSIASGVYFYRIETEDGPAAGRIAVLK